DDHRPAADRSEAAAAEARGRLALCAAVVRRAVRAAGAPSIDALPAAGDDRGLTTLDAYERWAEAYPPVAHNPAMGAEQSIVEPLLRRFRARRALDVGTGSGRYLSILSSTGARVIGVDFSRAMLARSIGTRVRADANALPFGSGSFDLVNASLIAGD